MCNGKTGCCASMNEDANSCWLTSSRSGSCIAADTGWSCSLLCSHAAVAGLSPCSGDIIKKLSEAGHVLLGDVDWGAGVLTVMSTILMSHKR